MKRLTPAQKRALFIAASAGYVMIDGAFSGISRGCGGFGRRSVVERLIAKGLLQPGRFFNQYELTVAGRVKAPKTTA